MSYKLMWTAALVQTDARFNPSGDIRKFSGEAVGPDAIAFAEFLGIALPETLAEMTPASDDRRESPAPDPVEVMAGGPAPVDPVPEPVPEPVETVAETVADETAVQGEDTVAG